MERSLISSRYSVTENEVRALEAFIKLGRATESLGAELHRCIGELGLTPEQLWELSSVLEREPLREGELEPPNLDSLEARGLLRRQRSNDDPHRVEVATTEYGKLLIQAAYAAYARRLRELMSVLSGAEQAELGHLCERLLTAIAAPV